MPFEVLLTEDAARDLGEIRIEEAIETLADDPARGAHPRELLALGIRDYRQTVSRPYRMIYRVIGRRVYVYLIADGRRDMQTLLARRLLQG